MPETPEDALLTSVSRFTAAREALVQAATETEADRERRLASELQPAPEPIPPAA